MTVDRWLHALPLRFRSLFHRSKVEHELAEELRFHIEEQTAQFIARGIHPDQARTMALRAMGGLERRKEEMRAERRVNLIEDLMNDVRLAIRRLRRTPGFTAVALLTLALGLGATTAIFSVVDAVLLRPLEYAVPDRLVVPTGTVAPAAFLEWHASNRTFQRIGAAEWWSPRLTRSDGSEQLTALRVTADIFPMLGVAPLLGRVPRDDEGHDGAPPVVVLSWRSWQTRFASDSNVVGQTIQLDGSPVTIIGVMPRTFRFAPYWATRAEMWAPLMLDARKADGSGASLRVFGRLRDGMTVAQARDDLARIAALLDPRHEAWAKQLSVVPLHSLVVEGVESQLVVLQSAVALLLLIACANVAHLQLFRAAGAERENAVRMAIGASSARIVQQSLVESLVLCASGSFLGLGVGYAAMRGLVAVAPPNLPRVDTIRFDGSVFLLLLIATAVCAAICGVVPALRASRVRVGDAMRAGRGSNDTPRRRRIREALVVSEFAMTMVLLVAAGLVLRSVVAMLRVDPGYDPRQVLVMGLSVQRTAHESQTARQRFFTEVEERARAMPGVEAAALTNHVPIGGDHWNFPVFIEGRPYSTPGAGPKALFRVARPGYFAAMRIPVKRGRDFTVDDLRATSRSVIVNESMARRHWPGETPLGKRLSVDDPSKRADWFTVVGVVGDIKQNRWTEESGDEMYYPYIAYTSDEAAGTLVSFLHPAVMSLVIRGGGDQAAVTRGVREIVRAIDKDVPVANIATMETIISGQLAQPKFYMMLLGAFAMLALVLAAVGVYGVISYSVAQRTRELGVRAALGATSADALRLVMTHGAVLTGIGCLIGLAAALGAAQLARSLLYSVAPTDMATFGTVSALLLGVGLVACYIPGRRAASVDPVIALKEE